MTARTAAQLVTAFGSTDPADFARDVADSLDANLAAASTTVAGKVELATDAEAVTGTDAARAITAANLRAVLRKLKFLSFDGKNGAGACTATGAAVGDLVLYVVGITDGALGNASASFESAVTVVNQIQQSAATNLSANDYLAVLLAIA